MFGPIFLNESEDSIQDDDYEDGYAELRHAGQNR